MSDLSADLRLSSYTYDLPPSFIAQTPAEPRHSARLLALGPAGEGSGAEQQVRHLSVWDLQGELRPGDLLVVNDTRVLKARLQARRASGGAVELLVLQPHNNAAPREAAAASSESCWICLVRPGKRVRPGEVLQLEAAGQPSLPLEVVALDETTGGRVIRFPPGCTDAASIEALLQRYGAMPLPPYIQHPDPEQESRYQTRYATRPGAVAAPTAGLHLSDELLEAIRARGVEIATATLHVGIGTFRPLEEEDLSSLDLHSEWVEISEGLVDAVAACRLRGGRVIAIGTTSVRSLEGVAALHDGNLVPFRGPVNLVIQPGFRFQVVQGLLTNFHLPRSSLLLLVSALIGRPRLLELYEEAKRQGYRFFSYGDAMWIAPEAVEEAARP
ncbi:tRNA preQ1(34) S-adenosylmethionine ribosyltransferase-isomerase QueA [Synechococcus sp. Cruz-9H2]|nr:MULTISPECIES: tRNA preQ1(34) S-adenosylmethionine ribosyltransferase-isomerase QueA [unclassified Synechococcus]MCP9819189.1 tRNA preQ1(34) S-adenosylmethionine ribosyltransferase-isomerase QueA [Synechococcus sp. Cruz-9H2]MCP9843693.1 tRNA preQ1(34) S-adenosylmethionine ribosyltransferase-isomerase QueA [Synechococcus sp. Edmonson 11F2]MCP9855588.1 tRNA preQ1(34) S-adenosylmethionine ribosyltransferase-isomerase QueA [Synechococcus sp. Cruz-9C9]MCP9863026.1 tRNA preQ1(34) S-adenosylmethioni